ncbi:MAG TPA: N-acetylmuramoyl-L-alanine amidase [Candidatus Coprenecus stercoripullorum]|nr:N-acetylmuramoyl-L-alanine amidase [Candidatus Coprenecus stercoripullorum]
MYEEANKAGYKGNQCVSATKYWVGNYGIVRDTKCPAVLTENLFQDNKEYVAILMSEAGKQATVDIHVKGIMTYLGK